jgi:hypothetical protein
MITRCHQKGDAESAAVYSACEAYRYALTRVWAAEAPRLLFVLLNPSTATELRNDPTVERCERRARDMGFGALRVCNIFAWRATDPRALKWAEDPAGPANDAALREGAAWADRVICGWGAHGRHLGRGGAVEAMLRGEGAALWHLGLTQDGAPRHPLYIGYDRQPEPWTPAGS